MPAEELATSVTGDGDRVVLVHGFTQTGRSWSTVAAALAGDHQVVAVDAPGHGGSAAARTDVRDAAALIGTAGRRATYVGYSMGGRMCLQLALDSPELVERLVLVSATAGIEDETERAGRRRHDDELAALIERDGVEAFVRWWVSQPLFAGLPDPGLADRGRNTVDGLAASLRLAGTGSMEPVWDRLGELQQPVLVVAGALDAKFVGVGQRLVAGIPGAELQIVEGAGHTVHLERPDAFIDVLRRWLSR